MTPFYTDDSVTVFHGDCLDVLRELPDNSVDSVCTDPPYGLEFMGREWDKFTDPRAYIRGISERDSERGAEQDGLTARRRNAPESYVAGTGYQSWCTDWAAECLRVLKPGGHMLAFGGSRTWHRLTCAIEDAGFEIRDSIAWLYGQGFPKSLNVSAALNDRRCRCPEGEWSYGNAHPTPEHAVRSVPDTDVSEAEGTAGGSGPLLLTGMQEHSSPLARRKKLPPAQVRAGQPCVEGWRDVQEAEGELHRPEVRAVPGGVATNGTDGRLHHGAPAGHGPLGGTDAVTGGSGEPHQPRPKGQPAGEPGTVPDERRPQAWGGWPVCERCSQPVIPNGLGTALKPAHEPIVVARKPLVGTVAGNVLAYGTGSLNIDGCRVGTPEDKRAAGTRSFGPGISPGYTDGITKGDIQPAPHDGLGRWPSNVVLDDSQAAELDKQSGWTQSPATVTRGGNRSEAYGMGRQDDVPAPGDSGGASRFFPTFRYEPKAPTTERPRATGIAHPTVKPLDLMRWLVRLVTPPGGTVLEPFAGSGTTAEACVVEGFNCIAIEREADYLPLIVQRLSKPIQVALDFDSL